MDLLHGLFQDGGYSAGAKTGALGYRTPDESPPAVTSGDGRFDARALGFPSEFYKLSDLDEVATTPFVSDITGIGVPSSGWFDEPILVFSRFDESKEG
jgi:hypothetical protein